MEERTKHHAEGSQRRKRKTSRAKFNRSGNRVSPRAIAILKIEEKLKPC